MQAYIGLGGNEGDPVSNLREATRRLSQLPQTQLMAVSPTYWTEPWGSATPQPEYLNAVVALTTDLSPNELLVAMQTIEHDLGRQRGSERYGPRALDLDLLVFGEMVMDDSQLTLPHPRLAERAFVLVPLCDIAPKLAVPTLDRVDYLLEALDAEELDGVRRAGLSISPSP